MFASFTALALGNALMAAPAPEPEPRAQWLQIERLQAIDNLDQGDMLGANRADFFAEVKINGKKWKTKVVAMDDAREKDLRQWRFPIPQNAGLVYVKIKVMDDDGGLERRDDHVDISRNAKRKDLWFTYNPRTGWVDGDVYGYHNETLMTWGEGNDDKAKMWFSLKSS